MKKSSCVLEHSSQLDGEPGSTLWKDYELRASIVATFWRSQADGEGLLHYDGPLKPCQAAAGGAGAEEPSGDCIEMWALLCQKMNMLEHQRRVVSLLDAWSFAPYFVATGEDPEVALWISLLEALQAKAPLKACKSCGDLFQMGSSQRALYCSQSCRQASYRAKREAEKNAPAPLAYAPRKTVALGQRVAFSPQRH
jgi:hypothetical protein